jgi:lysophospholipase L1-like esterase
MSLSDANRRAPRRTFRLATAALAVTVAFVIPELLCRALTDDVRPYRAIRFGNDPASEDLFVEDDDLQWSLRRDAAVTFMNRTVRTDDRGFRVRKPAPTPEHVSTVLCLGDSTAFGWGAYAEQAYPARLERHLGAAWRVHNAGVPGYSSHQLLLAARRWIPSLRPEYVVVCIGNNDAWPARQSDRAAFEGGGALARLLRRSAFFAWVADAVNGDRPPTNPLHLADDAVPRVADDEMVDNLRGVIALARAHGAEPLILGPPANLHLPPRNINEVIERWTPRGRAGDAKIQAGRPAEARALLDAEDPPAGDRIYFAWLRAMVTALAEDPARGRRELEEVYEQHRFPDRARQSYRDRQRDVADAASVRYADVNELFRRDRGAEQAIGLYLDWCHPTPEGHRIISEQLARWIER